MKKKTIVIIIGVIAALLVCCAAAVAVYYVNHRDSSVVVTVEETEQEIFALSGEVVEAAEEYFVIADALQGDVQVNFGEETVFEGLLAEEVKVGAYVFVDYNGQMTRSLPPQVFALRVSMHVVTGVVEEVGEGSVTVLEDGTNEMIVVHLPESVPELAVGTRIEAYTNGATTMSLPPQTAAAKIVVVLE